MTDKTPETVPDIPLEEPKTPAVTEEPEPIPAPEPGEETEEPATA